MITERFIVRPSKQDSVGCSTPSQISLQHCPNAWRCCGNRGTNKGCQVKRIISALSCDRASNPMTDVYRAPAYFLSTSVRARAAEPHCALANRAASR